MNEESLSDKIDDESLPMMEGFIFVSHVKEAVRRLKEEFENYSKTEKDFEIDCEIIDKIFGEKLK